MKNPFQLKRAALALCAVVLPAFIACSGGGGGGGSSTPAEEEVVTVSDGTMSEITYCSNVPADPIRATIKADPNAGPPNTKSTITITFSQGGDLVKDIETYQCPDKGTFFQTAETDPEKTSSTVWKKTGVLTGGAGVLRYYALAGDGTPLAWGEVALNGGGDVPGCDDDEIYDSDHVWLFCETTAWKVAPPDWEDNSADNAPPSAFGYRVTDEFDGTISLQIRTEGDTEDLFGVRTLSGAYESGRYQWKVYVPSMGADSGAVRAFLQDVAHDSAPNDREIGFEIRYGSIADRTAYGIAAGERMCFMTVQRDDSSVTVKSTDAVAVDPGNWYILQIVLTPNNDEYDVSWNLRKEGETAFSLGRDSYTCAYGPNDTSFHIECSVEDFGGGASPADDISTYFDYVFYTL